MPGSIDQLGSAFEFVLDPFTRRVGEADEHGGKVETGLTLEGASADAFGVRDVFLPNSNRRIGRLGTYGSSS